MTDRVVVLGAGYAGSAAIRSLDEELDDVDLTWISKEDYHLVLHEVHRCIRNPSIREHVTIPIDRIKPDGARFIEAEVTDLDTGDREVELADGRTVEYDYAVVCLGSRTAFYGIDGLEEHALTLKGLGDALAIRQHVLDAARNAGGSDPARVVVGGGGLTGIQAAGEIAQLRDDLDAPMEVAIVEHSDQLFAGHDHEFQGAIRNHLEDLGVEIDTGTTVSGVEDDRIETADGDAMAYDVLVWAGGITGQPVLEDADVSKDHNRVYTGPTLESSDGRVFALGDSALVDQDEEEGPLSEEEIWEMIAHPDAEAPVPPTAEAAMEAGEVLGKNVARLMQNRELIDWTYTNKGTAVSIGERAVAHGVIGLPLNTFSGPAARVLKRSISARWIGTAASWPRAARAWRYM